MLLRLLPLLAAFTLAACAGPASGPPRIERLAADEALRLGVAPPRPVTLDDIVAATRRGEAPPAIVQRLRDTHSVYRLTPHEIQRLEQAGVAREVLEHMTAEQRAEAQAAARRRAEDEVYRYPPYWHDPWYPYGPYWAPGVSLGAHRHFGRSGLGLGWGW